MVDEEEAGGNDDVRDSTATPPREAAGVGRGVSHEGTHTSVKPNRLARAEEARSIVGLRTVLAMSNMGPDPYERTIARQSGDEGGRGKPRSVLSVNETGPGSSLELPEIKRPSLALPPQTRLAEGPPTAPTRPLPPA